MFKEEKGITLIEIVVMVALIAIFSAILISDFPKMQRQFMLSRTAHKLAQDIRRAQDLALSGRKPTEDEKIAGYGIYLSTSNTGQYILYKDKVIDSSYDSKYSGDTSSESIETIVISDFSAGVSISKINDSTGSASVNFAPPNPTVTLTLGGSDATFIEITLISDVDNFTKVVKVNSAGLIEVQ